MYSCDGKAEFSAVITWFGAQESFHIIINVKNNYMT